MSKTDFIPRWASPPGDTIKEALEEQGLHRRALGEALGLPDENLQSLLDGSMPLTIKLADRLTAAIGGSVEFWMTRDGQYHADAARVAADAWAQRLPLRDMSAFGWIESDVDDWIAQIRACLQFFGVHNVSEWQAGQGALLARTRFRSSQVLERDELALAAWLRQCELELSEIDCGEWDPAAFTALLPELLPLTRMSDPQRFLPELRDRCAQVGVAVAVVRAPRKCPISGAARRLQNGQASIALSGRYRADDHLWFTFFHEAAHLVMHGTDAVYLDEIELKSEPAPTQDEAEADEFAARMLVPVEYEEPLARAKRSPLELRRLAREMGVSMGIVIGHLQHRGVIGYGTKFNKLKNRYRWNGPTLERA